MGATRLEQSRTKTVTMKDWEADVTVVYTQLAGLKNFLVPRGKPDAVEKWPDGREWAYYSANLSKEATAIIRGYMERCAKVHPLIDADEMRRYEAFRLVGGKYIDLAVQALHEVSRTEARRDDFLGCMGPIEWANKNDSLTEEEKMFFRIASLDSAISYWGRTTDRVEEARQPLRTRIMNYLRGR